MWNLRRSVFLSRIAIYILSLIFLVCVVFGQNIISWFIETRSTNLNGMQMFFSITIYSISIFVFFILYQLHILLKNITKEDVFNNQNIRCIRVCSWSCIIIAIICLVSSLYYLPFIIASMCAVFMGLLLRVVKNVFAKAKELKEENDFTI